MLKTISLTSFRNISTMDLCPAPGINLLLGENGSGKSSILEALHLIALGRSFRSRSLKNVIEFNAKFCRVFVRTDADIPVGLQFDEDNGLQLRLNNMPLKRLSELASYLPLQFISANSHQYFEQGPRFRRQMMDWGLFHVEPTFNYHWQTYKKALQQRNASIKQAKPDQELIVWNSYLIKHGEVINAFRQSYLEMLLTVFKNEFVVLCPNFINSDFQLRYLPGWLKDRSFKDVLDASLTRDRSLGYTKSGIHAADWSIRINGVDPSQMLSRGQQKLFYLALVVSQLKILNDINNASNSILLIDDLSSELDDDHQQLVLNCIKTLPTQCFITSTNMQLEKHVEQNKDKMFHVKQGCLD